MQEFNPVVEAIFRDRMEWKFAPWLAEVDLLFTLVFSEDVPVGYHANVFDLFETIYWPKLESVDLRTVMTPEDIEFLPFIRQHRRTLQYLRLGPPEIHERTPRPEPEMKRIVSSDPLSVFFDPRKCPVTMLVVE